jgi:DNA-binding GntR family transcriptional regulator
METSRYRQVEDFLLAQIQLGRYQVGDYLPSEHELCRQFGVTRTTVRRALERLSAGGFIERRQGRGSRVTERRKSLGLLNVRGFSEAVGSLVRTRILRPPAFGDWSRDLAFAVDERELSSPCIHFERLRSVGSEPVMLENNWFAASVVPHFLEDPFVEGSFFKTLSRRYGIEVTGSEQEIRALPANRKSADVLQIGPDSPVLVIDLRFSTSHKQFHIYSQLVCNTSKYPIGNSYFL